jgi:CSLREA domain-containing protein
MKHALFTRLIAKAARLAVLAALVAGLTLHLVDPSAAYAAGISVTTTADELNNNGNCSLREAIRAANTNSKVDSCAAGSSSSTDTITLQAGTYGLSLEGGNEDSAKTGDLDITGALTINGAGMSALSNLTIKSGTIGRI